MNVVELVFISSMTSLALVFIAAKVAQHDGLRGISAWVAGVVPVFMIIGMSLAGAALARLAWSVL